MPPVSEPVKWPILPPPSAIAVWLSSEEGYIEQTEDSPVISDNSGTRVLPTSLSRWWTEDRAKYGLNDWCLHEFRNAALSEIPTFA